MINVRIVSGTFFDEENNKIVMGGVETYIATLNNLLKEEGYNVILYQFSKEKYDKTINGIRIIGTGISRTASFRKDTKKLVDYIAKETDCENDVVLFSTETLLSKNNFKKSIAIQHGISWDITSQYHTSELNNSIAVLKSISKTLKTHLKINKCRNIVCVDYNFVNWYRTHIKHINNKMYVIPNFTEIIPYSNKEKNSMISIIFARRFVEYRGTKLFAEAIDEILKKFPNVEVTFAGEGPDEAWLKSRLGMYSNVSFTKFLPSESVKFHTKYDIAVVPTTGSEGTSLSLLEAMSAGCAVIASNVGGLSNIILDEYNGLLIFPNKEELVHGLEKLITDADFRNKLSKNAYETVSVAFSKEKWERSWLNVIKNVING